MKTTIVTHYFTPHVGGIEIVAHKQAKSLKKLGQEVVVITSKTDAESKEEVIDGFVVKRISAINIFEKHFAIPFPLFSPALIPVLIKEIKSSDICHIHDVFYISSLTAALIAKIFKKPVILTQHVAYVQHNNKLVSLLQKLVYLLAGKRVFTASSKIIVYNAIVKKFLISQGVPSSKVIQLRNGVDLTVFNKADKNTKRNLRKKYNLPLNKKIILFVGRLVSKKGYQKVLNAQDVEYLTIIIGSGNIPREAKNNKHVRFIGGINQAILADFYKMSDIFVLPSTGEVFTLAMQEAMASGLPIVTTKESEYKEFAVDDAHIKFISKKNHNLKKTIKSILRDKKTLSAMQKYSYSYARKTFNWEKNILDMVNIYKEVRV